MMELTKLREAAEHGDAEAQYELAVMCQRGDGVPQNYHKAVRWYAKAAEQGNTQAQAWLYSALADGSLRLSEVWEAVHMEEKTA